MVEALGGSIEEARAGRAGWPKSLMSVALVTVASTVGVATYNYINRAKIISECQLGDVKVHSPSEWVRYQQRFEEIAMSSDAILRHGEIVERRKALGYSVVHRLGVRTPSFGAVYRTMILMSGESEVARFTYRHFYAFSFLELVGISANLPDYTCPAPTSIREYRKMNYFL